MSHHKPYDPELQRKLKTQGLSNAAALELTRHLAELQQQIDAITDRLDEAEQVLTEPDEESDQTEEKE